MNCIATPMLAGTALLLATGGPTAGKLAFVGVFVLLLIWLMVLPRRLLRDSDARPPWWRNARVWAIAITLIQIVVYLRWG